MKFEITNQCLSSSVLEVFDSLLQDLKVAVQGVIKTVCCCRISAQIRYPPISFKNVCHTSSGESHTRVTQTGNACP